VKHGKCKCGVPLSRAPHRRKTDLCRRCRLKEAAKSIAFRQRLSEGQQRRWSCEFERINHGRAISKGKRAAMTDPIKRAQMQLRGRTVGQANRGRVWDREVVEARARAVSAAKLADIPPELRPAYREHQRKHKKGRAATLAAIMPPPEPPQKISLVGAPSSMEQLAESWRKKGQGNG
jgi:hypothetical protein